MHTSFTGAARKARQVNLSGRNTSNPWAALPGSAKSTSLGAGTQHAVAQAQADRLRRQQERDRINAAKRIQKTWRGHAVRRRQKQKWREWWDARESERLGLSEMMDFAGHGHQEISVVAYPSETICLSQLRLLVRFYNVKESSDTRRLLYFGNTLRATLQENTFSAFDEPWTRCLRRASLAICQWLSQSSKLLERALNLDSMRMEMLGLNTYITGIIPDLVAMDAARHFHSLRILLQAQVTEKNMVMAAISGFAITVLSHTTENQNLAYYGFMTELLTNDQLLKAYTLLEFLQQPIQLKSIAEVVPRYISDSTESSLATRGNSEGHFWLLAYLIYLRNSSTNATDLQSFPAWLHAVSSLLSICANRIAECIDDIDPVINTAKSLNTPPLQPFVEEQIHSLSQQSSIVQTIAQLKMSSRADDATSTMAKPLANYAVALLRAFPRRAANIRMWLYRGSPCMVGNQSTSTIRYLWQASEKTSVFHKIHDQNNVMSVLVEAAPEHNQIGRPQVTEAETVAWQEEWRIILLFLELYTFILKLMDDEEFFALDERNLIHSADSINTTFRAGALPLDDISRMTTFLKNLAFPLYWYAQELDASNEAEDSVGLAAYFGTLPTEPQRPAERKKPQTLAGNGVSQIYLKGLVTGLLRMLHERDSRRRFLREGHWLMTSRFDMQGFIPAVVAEEERRHEFGDVEDDDADEEMRDSVIPTEADDIEIDAIAPSLATMFGIRAPHTSQTQTSRFSQQMRKRAEVAKQKRQSESLVPRIEILRNLPFFIPFETRVQIFREFIYVDQMKRRKGMIDPDQWRMSVARSTQGRGPDGHTRALELISRHRAEIRRGSVFDDAYDRFYELGEDLKEPIQISFIDQFGATEAGIDGGGVTKEFLISVTSEAFDPYSEAKMFVENEHGFLYPNPTNLEVFIGYLQRLGVRPGTEEYKTETRGLLQRYEFIGRIVGKCLYEGILVDITFAGFFLLKWALTGGSTMATNETAYRASINDLHDFDESLYQGLLKLKNYTGDVESDFALNFTVTDELEGARGTYTVTRDLIPNGSKVAVTNANRLAYIDKITRYRLQTQPASVTNAFLKGLGRIIQPSWLAMFNQRELQKLVGGDNAELDIADLRRNTQYGGLYVIGDDGLEHPTVALFWKVLKEMNDDDRRKVLKFVTSTPRAPLLGFGHLNPKFSIRDSSEDQTRLPSTSTCVNLLKLPRYGDEKTMREKLLYAVNSGAGFDLS